MALIQPRTSWIFSRPTPSPFPSPPPLPPRASARRKAALGSVGGACVEQTLVRHERGIAIDARAKNRRSCARAKKKQNTGRHFGELFQVLFPGNLLRSSCSFLYFVHLSEDEFLSCFVCVSRGGEGGGWMTAIFSPFVSGNERFSSVFHPHQPFIFFFLPLISILMPLWCDLAAACVVLVKIEIIFNFSQRVFKSIYSVICLLLAFYAGFSMDIKIVLSPQSFLHKIR